MGNNLTSVAAGAYPYMHTAAATTASRPYIDADYVLRNHHKHKLDVALVVSSHYLHNLTDAAFVENVKHDLSREVTAELMKRMQFTKSENNLDLTTRFRARAWVFTNEEMKQFIKDITNA